MKSILSAFIIGKLSKLILRIQTFEDAMWLYNSISGWLGLVVSCSLAAYINPSKEYVYDYHTSVMAGSEDYVAFASSYNITGMLRVQRVGENLLKAKLENLKFEAHNGEFTPMGEFDTVAKDYQQLNPLMEPFHIGLDANNLANGVVLSGDIPEWARNIHRGIATSLQLDSARAGGQETNFEVDEVRVTYLMCTIILGQGCLNNALIFWNCFRKQWTVSVQQFTKL